jgi:hypothetical protein
MGVSAEGAIPALADLAGVFCDKLPARKRSPFRKRLAWMKDAIDMKLTANRLSSY